MQWTYTCGNNWGFCADGSGALGCGPQETFRACADVAIHDEPPLQNDADYELLVNENLHNDEFSSHANHDHVAHDPSAIEVVERRPSEPLLRPPSDNHLHNSPNDVNFGGNDMVLNVNASAGNQHSAKLVAKKEEVRGGSENDRQEEKKRKKIRPGIRRPNRYKYIILLK